jgi:hypothetical protein
MTMARSEIAPQISLFSAPDGLVTNLDAIPSSVEVIGNKAFSGRSGLNDVLFQAG